MKEEQNIAQLVDRYLYRELTSLEVKAFEERLLSDQELKEELELEQTIRGVVVDDGLLAWKSAIQIETNTQRKKKRFKKLILFSVAVLSLLVSVWWSLEEPKKEAEEKEIPSLGLVKEEVLAIEKEKDTVESIQQVAKVNNEVGINGIQEEISLKEETIEESEVVEEADIEVPLVEAVNQEVKPDSVIVDPCIGVAIDGEIKTKPSCEGEYNGVISIANVKGGDAGYVYCLEKDKKWSNNKVFTDLAYGEYTVVVKDANDCESILKKDVLVDEIYCYKPEAGFNPDFETWDYQIEGGKKVTIYNKLGKVVYEAEVNDTFVWDGRDLKGQKVSLGLYKYIVETESGKKIGTVTVVY